MVILYLQGKLDGAKSIKAWAFKRAQWLRLDQQRKDFGRPSQKPKYRSKARYFQRLETTYLVSLDPSALTRAEQRQEIERADHLTRQELADVI